MGNPPCDVKANILAIVAGGVQTENEKPPIRTPAFRADQGLDNESDTLLYDMMDAACFPCTVLGAVQNFRSKWLQQTNVVHYSMQDVLTFATSMMAYMSSRVWCIACS